MRLGVQYPIHAGGYAAAYDASAVNDTDWHSLSSTDFYDAQAGTQLSAGLKFAYVEFVSSSTNTVSFGKLRAAGGAGDGTGNTDGVIPIMGSYSVDVQALVNGTSVTSIAYKKAAGGDKFTIIAGFNS
ncbi:MAG: hypothetical protein Unbinned2299contig1001_15 [Prokaryotic dsDNA virus sp.]|nr:MAG: hypothetical protein Unbinned2299contig1001_15 [Prokaryotic dsDNA virus sp.]|tara:strand:+ start:2334 stop:2717 length:384 start_codon:yes stop_codon:yes gene_type:complete